MGECFITRRGGTGLTGAYAIIGVEFPSGSTVTCSDGTKTYTAKSTDGYWYFGVPYAGDWTIYVTQEDEEVEDVVSITYQYQVVVISLDFIVPQGYTRLNYLESTGVQAIYGIPIATTNYYGTINVDMMRTGTGSTTGRIVSAFSGSTLCSGLAFYGGVWQPYVGATKTTSTDMTINQRFVAELVVGNNGSKYYTFSLDETEISTGSHSLTTRPAKVSLFGGYNGGNRFVGRIYECQYYDQNGILLANLIPALRDTDSKPGFYESVNQVFYVNNLSSDDFTYG